MENFYFSSVQFLLGELNRLIVVSNNNMRVDEKFGGPYDPRVQADPHLEDAIRQSAESARFVADGFGRYFSWLNCAHIDDAAKRLHRWPEQEVPRWSELNTRSRALRDVITTELKGHIFYQYPRSKGIKLKAWKAEWQSALTAFPRIDHDVLSATDCYAQQHDTACVFHCMRILEVGLKAIAADVGLTFDVQQWHNIIEQIESKIAGERKSIPQGSAKNKRLQFLSEAAKESFSILKTGGEIMCRTIAPLMTRFNRWVH